MCIVGCFISMHNMKVRDRYASQTLYSCLKEFICDCCYIMAQWALNSTPDTHLIPFQARPIDYSTPVTRHPSHPISDSSYGLLYLSHQTPISSHFRLVLLITLPQSPDTHPIPFQARPMDYSTPVTRHPSHPISDSSYGLLYPSHQTPISSHF